MKDGKILYYVLCTTSQNQPWIEAIYEEKSIADLMCDIYQEEGIFSIVVEKDLNRLPVSRNKMQNKINKGG